MIIRERTVLGMLQIGEPCLVDQGSEKVVLPYQDEIRSVRFGDNGTVEIGLKYGGSLRHSFNSDLTEYYGPVTRQQLFQKGGFWYMLAGALPILPCSLQGVLREEIYRVAGMEHIDRVELALAIANRKIPLEDYMKVHSSIFFRKPLAILIGALTPDGCF